MMATSSDSREYDGRMLSIHENDSELSVRMQRLTKLVRGMYFKTQKGAQYGLVKCSQNGKWQELYIKSIIKYLQFNVFHNPYQCVIMYYTCIYMYMGSIRHFLLQPPPLGM